MRCWTCNTPADNMQYLEVSMKERKAYICKQCGCIQARLNMEHDFEEPIGSFMPSKNRDYTHIIDEKYSRLKSYAECMDLYINFKNVSTFMDIGGHEGILSNIINKERKVPNCFVMDPDERAISVGENLFPNITFSASSLEKYSVDSKTFDVIIHTGTIYRSCNPHSCFVKLNKMMNKNSWLIIPLFVTLENGATVQWGPVNSYKELFRHGEIPLLYSTPLASDVLSHYFQIIAILPFKFEQQTKPPVPVYFLKKKLETIKKYPEPNNHYKANLDIFNNYFSYQSRLNIPANKKQYTI